MLVNEFGFDHGDQIVQLREIAQCKLAQSVLRTERELVVNAGADTMIGFIPPDLLVRIEEAAAKRREGDLRQSLFRRAAPLILLIPEESRRGRPGIDVEPVRANADIDVALLGITGYDPAILLIEGQVGVPLVPPQ